MLMCVTSALPFSSSWSKRSRCDGNVQRSTLMHSQKVEPVIYSWLSGQLAADTFITFTTAYGLWKSKTGWSQTDRIIRRLVT